MKGYVIWFVVLMAAAMAVQVVLGYKQYRLVNKQFAEIKKRNEVVSVGKSKKRGLKRMAVLAFDSEGYLKEMHILSGITVFASLKKKAGEEGRHYQELKELYKGNKKMHCVLNAIEYMEE